MNDELFLVNPKQRDVAMGIKRYRNDASPIVIGVLLVGTFLLLGLIIGKIWINNWNKYRLGERSITTQATVVDAYTRRSDDSTSYYITYEFRYTSPNGEPAVQRSEISTSRDAYQQVKDGAQFTVWYNPDDPTISTQRPPNSFLPILIELMIMSAGLIVISLVVLVGYGFWMSKLHRLERDGQLIYGTLTSISGGTDSDGGFSLDATWVTLGLHHQFITPHGREIKARKLVNLAASQHDGKPVPPVGTPVAIWYADDKTYKIL